MKTLKQRLAQFEERLSNDHDYEMSEAMQEEYLFLKGKIEQSIDLELQEKFQQLSDRYDNPEKLKKDVLRDMYPETDGNYELDEWGEE